MFVNTLVQMAAYETIITCIVQVTFEFVNKALLIHNLRLRLSQFEILFNLLAWKDGLYSRMNLLTLILLLDANNISRGLIFKCQNNTNGI